MGKGGKKKDQPAMDESLPADRLEKLVEAQGKQIQQLIQGLSKVSCAEIKLNSMETKLDLLSQAVAIVMTLLESPSIQNSPTAISAAVATAMASADSIQEKAQGLVICGWPEAVRVEDCASHDQAILDKLIQLFDNQQIRECRDSISFFRFPRERKVDFNPKYPRILKLRFPSIPIRDNFYKLCVTNRVGRLAGTGHAYVRPDLTREQLILDRELRTECGKRNAAVGERRYVVRDARIVELQTPRPLDSSNKAPVPNNTSTPDPKRRRQGSPSPIAHAANTANTANAKPAPLIPTLQCDPPVLDLASLVANFGKAQRGRSTTRKPLNGAHKTTFKPTRNQSRDPLAGSRGASRGRGGSRGASASQFGGRTYSGAASANNGTNLSPIASTGRDDSMGETTA